MGDPEARLEATIAATLAEAGLASDADPGSRLGGGRALPESQLESMLGALQPLPVSHEGDPEGELQDLVVRGVLGVGGMGVVELAHQKALDREVALKRLRDPPGSVPGPQVFGLLDEARVGGRLEHPNIVPVHAIGRDEELGPIVLFKRVQGETWAKALERDADSLPGDALTLERHLRIMLQVGNALRFAHSVGVLHRDVKPENVMLGPFGEVYLLDWGLAFPLEGSREGIAAVAGTASYMAPEMARGDIDALGPTSDVFLLGATLHEVVTGLKRHRGSGVAHCLLAALVAAPADYARDVPAELGAIINRACAADPAHRFQSVEELQEAIEDFLEQREARVLVRSAQELLAPIDAADAAGQSTEHAVRDQAEAMRRFQEARFALDQALRLRPGFVPAKRQKRHGTLLMIRWSLAREDVEQAMALAAELEEPPPRELSALIEAMRANRREQREHVEQLERDFDTSVAHPDRARAMVAALVGLTAAHVIGWIRHPGPGLDLPPLSLLQEGALFAGAIFLALLVVRRRLSSTRLNRQFMRGVGAIGLSILGVRAIGVLAPLAAPSILAVELLVVSTIMVCVQTPVRRLPEIGLVGVGLSLVAVWQPSIARYLYIGLSEVTAIGLTIGLLLEGRTSDSAEP